jgi:hypothetical protein
MLQKWTNTVVESFQQACHGDEHLNDCMFHGTTLIITVLSNLQAYSSIPHIIDLNAVLIKTLFCNIRVRMKTLVCAACAIKHLS